MLYVQLLLFGLCIGVMSGMLGIGGGIILVPGLMFLFSFTQQEAQGTSLAAMIPPIGIFAAMVYYKNGDVKIPVAAAVAGGFMIGAYLGAQFVNRVPVAWLQLAFGTLLLYVGFRFVFAPQTTMMAALPAGLATFFAAIGAWLRGKRAAAIPLPPPDERHEYHI